jgi:Kef-type K+ transport system membrane component KefB
MFGFCLLSAAFTEYIHLHAILGSFIAGIAVGDSVHLKEKAREIIHQFVTNFFAPLFFVSIGLKVNFITNFDALIVGLVLVLAYFGKIFGASIGAYLGGMKNKSALAVGFGLNARGAMEIILGTLALNAGIIKENVFVALVILALISSITSAPLMKRFLK